MDLRSNNMLSNLLPLLMNQGDTGSIGAGNNMLAMLLPMLMQRGGASGSSNEILKSLLPMMAGNNPQLSQILNNLNTGGDLAQENYAQDDKPIAVSPQNINNKYISKGRRNIDFGKLYPDLDSLDIHTMPKIDDYKKEQSKNISYTSNNTDNNDFQNNHNTNNSLMTLLTLMQNLKKQPSSNIEEKMLAVDGIAPPKIKKSLKAILALNNIIKD
ncbi:MAG TPA: hypothetical protein GX745_04005 [Clostridiales bacterium]|nr:hypothetical protein [Clostridiales bacterium]